MATKKKTKTPSKPPEGWVRMMKSAKIARLADMGDYLQDFVNAAEGILPADERRRLLEVSEELNSLEVELGNLVPDDQPYVDVKVSDIVDLIRGKARATRDAFHTAFRFPY